MLTKTDCFAYMPKKNGTAKCDALKDQFAHCDGCTFYKTVGENELQEAVARMRLAGLGSNDVKKRKGE